MKPLSELTLLDRFLFSEAMEDPENLQTMLEIILGKDIVLKYLPQTEKEQKSSPIYRHIRLDVWGLDQDGTVYDTEVQKRNTKNLPRRSRYYQGWIDSRLLQPGEVDFNSLQDIYVIMICPFDLFGDKKYCHTFRMRSVENPEVILEDGGTRIFLNTHGTNPEEVSPELVELLYYIEHTNEKSESLIESARIRGLRERVNKIKEDEEVGARYMQEWEEREIAKREARAVGQAEGITEERRRILKLIKEGYSLEELCEVLEKEKTVF